MFAFIGLTAFWPFLTVYMFVHEWVPADVLPGIAHTFAMDYSLVLTIIFLVIFFLRNKLSKILSNNIALGIIGLLGAVGTAMVSGSQSNHTAAGAVVAILGMLLMACFVAGYVVAWGIRLQRLGSPTRVLLIGLFSSVACRILACIYWCLGFDQSILFIVRPVIAALAFILMAPRDTKEASPAGQDAACLLKRLPWAAIVPTVLLLFLVSVLAQLLNGFDVGSMVWLEHIANAGVITLSTCLIALFVARGKEGGGFTLLSSAIFSACALALVAVFFLPGLVADVTFVERALLVVWLWALFAEATMRAHLNPLLTYPLFGILGVSLMGIRFFDHAAIIELVLQSGFFAQILAVLACAVSIAVVVIVSLSSVRRSADSKADSQDHVRGFCERACAGAGLSERELEIVTLTYRGKSARVIGDELSISEYTVKNHLARAYRKMGIHSKQELISYIDGMR